MLGLWFTIIFVLSRGVKFCYKVTETVHAQNLFATQK